MAEINFKDYQVLFVDDESDARSIFKLNVEDEFSVVTAQSGEEALEILKTSPNTAVVLSDQKMKGMEGTKLLEIVEREYPDTVKMLVTAFSTYDIALEAINVGRVYGFIEKPWRAEEIVLELKKAIEYYCLKQSLKKEISEKTKALEELKRTQNMLVQTEKLSTIGELTASFAHEIRNPISIISGNAEFQLKKLVGDINKVSIDKTLREIVSQSERVSEIIEKIRAFAKPSKAELQVVNLVEVINSSIDLVNQEIKSHSAELSVNLDDIDHVLGDKLQLEQVFVNLIRNSIQAMGNSGRLQIKSFVDHKERMVVVTVRDYGPGIPENNLDKLFKIFFTTKERGTGVGLFISNQIVNSIGGKINVESQPGEGTVFTVTIPRINK